MVYLRVDELLKERQKSNYWLIKQMEGSRSNVKKIIRNETVSIEFRTIDKLCKIFDCEIGDLFVLKIGCFYLYTAKIKF